MSPGLLAPPIHFEPLLGPHTLLQVDFLRPLRLSHRTLGVHRQELHSEQETSIGGGDPPMVLKPSDLNARDPIPRQESGPGTKEHSPRAPQKL